MITRESLPWFPTDAEQLRHFLETETGQRLLPKLVESTPGLLASGDVNAMLVRSGEVRGCQILASAFLTLAYPPPDVVEAPRAYPELEDDSQWPSR